MIVAIFGDKILDSRADQLAAMFQDYWASRGIAVYSANFYAPAIEMSGALEHIGSRYNLPEGVGASLTDAMVEWGNKIPHTLPTYTADFWLDLFNNHINEILHSWREMKLPHFLVVTGLNSSDRISSFPAAFRVSICRDKYDTGVSSLFELNYTEDDKLEDILEQMCTHCSEKIMNVFAK